MIHIHNGRAQRHPQTQGCGVTWCGKKLLGRPEVNAEGFDTFTSYGNQVIVSQFPDEVTCEHCRKAFDAAYNKAFPEGLKPIATSHADNPEEVARAKALLGPDAMRQFFGPGGGGMTAFEQAMREAVGEGARHG